MHKISLKEWVILLTILPITLIGIALAGYFSYSYSNDLDDFLSNQSKSIIEPIAIASADFMAHRDREKLRNLIGFVHRNHSNIIKSITIFTKDNQVFVTSSYHGDINFMRLGEGSSLPKYTTMQKFDNAIIFRSPIINEIDPIDMPNNDKRQNLLGYIAIQIDKSKLEYQLQNKIIFSFFLVFLGVLCSGFFTIILIKKVTRPITSMIQAIDKIREGKLDSRVSGQLIGELNFLKNGINSMAQSLSAYHNEMQRSIDQATTDLRESLEQFEIQNVELSISKRKAQDTNRIKSEFLANMSHELRTPLNGVIGFTRQVLKTPLSETQRDYLQTIENSANNLLAIINDILDFSKLDAGKMIIESIPFSFRDSMEEAITLIAPSAHNKNLELSLRISEQLPNSLIGDAMRIKQVVVNLTNNAIKFTEQGSVTIDVDVEYIEQQSVVIKITVTDTGIGINLQQQKSIFDAFSQADRSISRLYGGTGLGLVISQHLAKEMRGDIGFFSDEKNGSSFWFTFQCNINPLPITTPINTKALVGKHVLYLEPKTHSRITTSEIMESWQMIVHPVTQLDQLTALLSTNSSPDQQHYDFALISYHISPTSINRLKSLITALKTRIPLIYLAVNSNSPNLHETLIASGAKNCLSTPITPNKLAKVLLPDNHQIQSIETSQNQIIPIKVLAVDDNEANLKLIKSLLLEQVEEVITASNGRQAVKLCETEKYSVIYMDIQMPIMDGISALKIIKTNSLNSDTPIIAVTAHALTEEKEQLLEEGFTDYITKPIDETMLRHTIYEYCDLNFYNPLKQNISRQQALVEQKEEDFNGTFSWELALKRASNKQDLAKEMFTLLINSLAETKQTILNAIEDKDIASLQKLIHKLNGACCYSGVPNLNRIVIVLEKSFKQGMSIDELEPEILELFEHIDNLLIHSSDILTKIANTIEPEDEVFT